jgi:hypothetical protein
MLTYADERMLTNADADQDALQQGDRQLLRLTHNPAQFTSFTSFTSTTAQILTPEEQIKTRFNKAIDNYFPLDEC